MIEVNTRNSKDFILKVERAILNNSSFKIVVIGWRRKILNKSIPMFQKYFYENIRNNKNFKRIEILKFIPYAMLTPILWGFVFLVAIKNWEVIFDKQDAILIITCIKEDKTEK